MIVFPGPSVSLSILVSCMFPWSINNKLHLWNKQQQTHLNLSLVLTVNQLPVFFVQITWGRIPKNSVIRPKVGIIMCVFFTLMKTEQTLFYLFCWACIPIHLHYLLLLDFFSEKMRFLWSILAMATVIH